MVGNFDELTCNVGVQDVLFFRGIVTFMFSNTLDVNGMICVVVSVLGRCCGLQGKFIILKEEMVSADCNIDTVDICSEHIQEKSLCFLGIALLPCLCYTF